ncbi:hypothetical protein MLD38_025031 [Melastoma candidum]|uniref:Uncharacterized protein n=1 Tax=Melastoma candidum TaxID=119954 RepID=A0ACB9NTU8_9MYRT|nr:hypothetical protein MLD38_025031 [Melastoma candidum]
MLVAFPRERVKQGSVLTMKLRGQISDQLKSSGLSLPQISVIKGAPGVRRAGLGRSALEVPGRAPLQRRGKACALPRALGRA